MDKCAADGLIFVDSKMKAGKQSIKEVMKCNGENDQLVEYKSRSGFLDIEFYSDGFGNQRGFKFQVQCHGR